MEDVSNDPAILDQLKKDAGKSRRPEVPVLDWIDLFKTPYPKSIPVDELSESNPLLGVMYVLSMLEGGTFPGHNFPSHALSSLAKQFSIPTAFLEHESRSVTHSFGSLDTSDGYRCCWFDYLCKNITVSNVLGQETVIADPRFHSTERSRHSDFTWIRASFFLRWSIEEGAWPHVTLICFGDREIMRGRFLRLSYKAVENGVVRDPMRLFVVILHELSAQMDKMAWSLCKVFGGIETKALSLDRERESFTGLHNISKHIIYLQESSEAALETARNIRTHHEDLLRKSTLEERAAGKMTRRTIAQVEAEFQVVKLRLRSLDKRMQNVVALSFHLVTQGDEYMQADSSTMATVAFVTLVFLPITTVSTIFGSHFFNAAPDNASILVSKDF